MIKLVHSYYECSAIKRVNLLKKERKKKKMWFDLRGTMLNEKQPVSLSRKYKISLRNYFLKDQSNTAAGKALALHTDCLRVRRIQLLSTTRCDPEREKKKEF